MTNLPGLALDAAVGAQEEVLHVLLGDRRAALQRQPPRRCSRPPGSGPGARLPGCCRRSGPPRRARPSARARARRAERPPLGCSCRNCADRGLAVGIYDRRGLRQVGGLHAGDRGQGVEGGERDHQRGGGQAPAAENELPGRQPAEHAAPSAAGVVDHTAPARRLPCRSGRPGLLRGAAGLPRPAATCGGAEIIGAAEEGLRGGGGLTGARVSSLVPPLGLLPVHRIRLVPACHVFVPRGRHWGPLGVRRAGPGYAARVSGPAPKAVLHRKSRTTLARCRRCT